MASLQAWCRIRLVGADATELACCTLRGPGAPDLGAVDEVARLSLLAKHLGVEILLTDVTQELRSLLDLAGLDVEMERQFEVGKEPLGIQEGQEETHPGDLPL